MAEQFQKPQHKIEPIEEITPRHPVDKVDETERLVEAEKIKFNEALERADPARANVELRKTQIEEGAPATQKPSLLDLAKRGKAIPTGAATTEALAMNATGLRKSFQGPRAQLMSYQSKSIEIPSEFSRQMDTRIEHMDKSLIDAKQLASGIRVESAIDVSSSSPTRKFLGFLTDADKRLETIVSDINTYTSGGKKLSPEKLLSIQIKLNYVQQEMEFFTNILNRSIESIKTLMNVQI